VGEFDLAFGVMAAPGKTSLNWLFIQYM